MDIWSDAELMKLRRRCYNIADDEYNHLLAL